MNISRCMHANFLFLLGRQEDGGGTEYFLYELYSNNRITLWFLEISKEDPNRQPSRRNLNFVRSANQNELFHLTSRPIDENTKNVVEDALGPRYFVGQIDEIKRFLLTGGWNMFVYWADKISLFMPTYLHLAMSLLSRLSLACFSQSVFIQLVVLYFLGFKKGGALCNLTQSVFTSRRSMPTSISPLRLYSTAWLCWFFFACWGSIRSTYSRVLLHGTR